jgi:hypothetical protein
VRSTREWGREDEKEPKEDSRVASIVRGTVLLFWTVNELIQTGKSDHLC